MAPEGASSEARPGIGGGAALRGRCGLQLQGVAQRLPKRIGHVHAETVDASVLRIMEVGAAVDQEIEIPRDPQQPRLHLG